MPELTAEGLRAALASYDRQHWPALPGRKNDVPAAILLPLLLEREPRALFTKRTATLRKHAGEICFPGGRPDEVDEDLKATALREANEEVGLIDVCVVGQLSSIPLYTSDFRLEPFVGVVPKDATFTLCADEVDSLVFLSLDDVFSLPHLHCIDWFNPLTNEHRHAPVFESPAGLIFGGTAYAFLELLKVIAPLLAVSVPPLQAGRYQWSDVLAGNRS